MGSKVTLKSTVSHPYHCPTATLTLTNLYNERATWLDLAHRALDEAAFDAYGWQPPMTDEEILAALLELNLERSAVGEPASPAAGSDDGAED